MMYIYIKYNKDFIAQQNKLCNEMKNESAKILHMKKFKIVSEKRERN